jgi:prepilin-type N-terminal cleavage/methylation domain-containing protein
MKVNVNKNRIQSGFSLIEVLVSLSIFTVVMVMAIGMLMVLIDANARAQNIQTVMVNLSFALDSITREARTGTDFFCGLPTDLPTSGATTQNCASGGAAFSFNEGGKSLTENTPNNSRRIGIRVNNGVLERRLGNGDGDATYEDVDWSPITSSAVHITDLEFYVSGATRSDSTSPTVTIYIAGTAGAVDGSEGTFHIQTTVVQQLLDV